MIKLNIHPQFHRGEYYILKKGSKIKYVHLSPKLLQQYFIEACGDLPTARKFALEYQTAFQKFMEDWVELGSDEEFSMKFVPVPVCPRDDGKYSELMSCRGLARHQCPTHTGTILHAECGYIGFDFWTSVNEKDVTKNYAYYKNRYPSQGEDYSMTVPIYKLP